MTAIFYDKQEDLYAATGGLAPRVEHLDVVNGEWLPQRPGELPSNLKVFPTKGLSSLKHLLRRAYYSLIGLKAIKVAVRTIKDTSQQPTPFKRVGNKSYWLVAVGYETYRLMDYAAFTKALAKASQQVIERA